MASVPFTTFQWIASCELIRSRTVLDDAASAGKDDDADTDMGSDISALSSTRFSAKRTGGTDLIHSERSLRTKFAKETDKFTDAGLSVRPDSDLLKSQPRSKHERRSGT